MVADLRCFGSAKGCSGKDEAETLSALSQRSSQRPPISGVPARDSSI